MNAIEKEILQAQTDIQYKQDLLDAQGEPERELERAKARLEALKLEASTYEADKEKKRAEILKLEKAQAKNIGAFLQAMDTGWEAAFHAVCAVRDANQLDGDNDMPRKWTNQGGGMFGTVENLLSWLEVNAPEVFELGKVRSRHERGAMCEAQGIPSQGYQRY
jgi:hypothetical protein